MASSGPQKYPGANTDKYYYQSKYSGDSTSPDTVVWHSTETTGMPGYKKGAVAPNFTVQPDFKRNRMLWFQHFNFGTSSRALVNADGGVQTNRSGVTQIEVVGTCDPKIHKKWTGAGKLHLFMDDLPDWAIADLAAFAKWAKDNHAVPLVSPLTWKHYDASYGAKNGVRMKNDVWTKFKGHCGHQHVPENLHGDPGAFPIAAILKVASKGTAPTSTMHVVAKGETMFGIAKAHGLTLAQLVAANPQFKEHPELLPIGTALVIPIA